MVVVFCEISTLQLWCLECTSKCTGELELTPKARTPPSFLHNSRNIDINYLCTGKYLLLLYSSPLLSLQSSYLQQINIRNQKIKNRSSEEEKKSHKEHTQTKAWPCSSSPNFSNVWNAIDTILNENGSKELIYSK